MLNPSCESFNDDSISEMHDRQNGTNPVMNLDDSLSQSNFRKATLIRFFSISKLNSSIIFVKIMNAIFYRMRATRNK